MTPVSAKPAGRRRLSVAPMMDWTDCHCRVFHRQITQHIWLYTEMVTTGARVHGEVERHLRNDGIEHPVTLQLGGSDPANLAHSAKLGEQRGYEEISLNCGCLSERVQKGAIADAGCKTCIEHARNAVHMNSSVSSRTWKSSSAAASRPVTKSPCAWNTSMA